MPLETQYQHKSGEGESYELRDFRQGRYTKSSIAPYLTPENSVAGSININFDEIVGLAKVRPGTVKLGNTVIANNNPLGLGTFVGKGGIPNLLLAVYTGDTQATIYLFDPTTGNWQPSALTNLDNTVKNRFATFGGQAFITNSVNGMFNSPDGNNWNTNNSINTYKPSLTYRYIGRLLAAGDPTFPDRVFFSSIIDSASDPFITWNVDPLVGDWIDVNPDDGGYVTGFSETSTFVLVFKNTGVYRMDTVAKTVDPENIFNVGAVSQEAIVLCQGIVYYFSGTDIRRTNGGYPEQISRTGVQDFIDAIPIANWESVSSGTDGLNVYFSIGDVTVRKRNYTNIVLKFSPRDQNWSIHSYYNRFKFFAPFVTTVNAL